MKFAISRIWREPINHTNDCYFCMVDPSKRRTAKKASAIVYPSIPSSIAPVPHSDQLPVPIPSRCQDSVSAEESTTDEDIGVSRIFDWGGGPNHKSHAMTSSEIFEKVIFCGAKIS